MRWQLIVIAGAAVFLPGCSPGIGETKHAPVANLDGLIITMVRTGCYGLCPRYAVEVKGDGAITYCGVNYVLETGERSRKVDLAKIGQLVEAFEAANFLELKDEYRASITDNPTTDISIIYDGREKIVSDYVGEKVGMPRAVTELQDAIDRVAGTADWIGNSMTNEMGGWPWPNCGTKYFFPPTVIEPQFH